MKRLFVSVLALAAVALGAPLTASAQDAISIFQNVTPVALDANTMAVEVRKRPPAEYPHVGHRAPVPLEQAINMWAKSRFALTGAGENTLRVTVREADIVEKLLPVKKGIAGWFRKDQSAEYALNVDIAVELIDANGRQQGTASATTSNSTTVPEGTTDAEKQAVWAEMMKKAFDNLDRELLPRVQQTLARGAG
ncbi:MAG: hypothetical protein IT566_01080 [Rhodospirillaceae bacterium]|nr:hypothetical protein [Rhodospirillaceae bacterium]